MARKNHRRTSRKSSTGSFKRTLSKACLSIAAVPLLLSNPATAVAITRTISVAQSTRESLSGGDSLIIENTGLINTPLAGVDLTGDLQAGNISNDGSVYAWDIKAGLTAGIDLTGGSAGLITNAADGTYAVIDGYSYGYADDGGYTDLSVTAAGVNIDGTSLTGVTNNTNGYIEGSAYSNTYAGYYGYYENGYGYSNAYGTGLGVSITGGSTLSGAVTNSGVISGDGFASASAYSDAFYGDADSDAYGAGSGIGLNVSGSTLSAGITNSGLIAGDAQAQADARASVTGYGYGYCYWYCYYSGYYGDANATAVANGAGVMISDESSVAGITNNLGGTIQGYSDAYSRATGDYSGYYRGYWGGYGKDSQYGYAEAYAFGKGIAVSSSAITGSITNHGTINGTGSAGADGGGWDYANGFGTGIDLKNSSMKGSIVNSGQIEGLGEQTYGYGYDTTGTGINIDNSSLVGITNNASGEILGTGDSDIYSYGYSNRYSARSDAYAYATGVGVDINGGSTLSGAVTNHGTITGEGLGSARAYSYGYYTDANADAYASGSGIGLQVSGSTLSAGITNNGVISGEGRVDADADASVYGYYGGYCGPWGCYYYGGYYGSADASAYADGVGLNITGGSTVSGITNNLGGAIHGSGMAYASASGDSSYGGWGGYYGDAEAYGFGTGIVISDSTISGDITNHGKITGYGYGSAYGGYWGGYAYGDGVGIEIDNSSVANITNSGSISGSGHSYSYGGGYRYKGFYGYYGYYGGDGQGIGLKLSGSSASVGSITNTGRIFGSADSIGTGIELRSDASVTGISNDGGSIYGAGRNESTGIEVNGANVDSITNSNYGYIYGYYGLNASGITVTNSGSVGSITNSDGIIGAYGYRSAAGIEVDQSGSITSITNNAGGLIVGYGSSASGISVTGYGSIGSITNNADAEISAYAYGYGYGYGDAKRRGFYGSYSAAISASRGGAITGGITNNGTIYGSNAAIGAFSGEISGEIVNSGDIYGNTGITASGYYGSIGAITNNATGTIYGDRVGISASRDATIGSITNRGDIGGDIAAIYVDNSKSSGVDGSISNEAGALIAGGKYGIYAMNDISGGINNAGTIYGGYSALSLSKSSPITVTNTGLIDGAVALGIGTLDLDGETGRVTGIVSGGPGSTVNVNGTFNTEDTFDVDSFNIATGATLNMANDIAAASGVSNDGVLSVAAGELVTIDGDYTQTANGVFNTGATDASTYGQLAVTGTADLTENGAVDVDVTANDTLADGDLLSGVISAGTLSVGELTVTDDSAMWDFIGLVNGNDIDLLVDQALSFVEAVSDTDQEPSSLGAAGVLDGLSSGDDTSDEMQDVLNEMGALESKEEIAKAVANLLPGFNGSYARMTQRIMAGNAAKTFRGRLDRLRGLSSGDDTFKDTELWGEVFASQADQDKVTNMDGYSADSYGFSIGADTEISPDWRIGAAMTYSQSDIDGDATTNREGLDIDTYQGALYAIGEIAENTELSFSAAYGHNDNDATRNINFGALNSTARADFDSWHTYLDAELAHSYQVGEKTTLTPTVKAQYSYASIDSYTETGAGALNLTVNETSADALVASLDTKLDHDVTEQLNLNAHLGFGYDFLTDQSSITSSFQGGGSTFVTDGVDPDPVVISGGVGLEMATESGTKVSLGYDIEAREDYDNQTVWLKLQVPL